MHKAFQAFSGWTFLVLVEKMEVKQQKRKKTFFRRVCVCVCVYLEKKIGWFRSMKHDLISCGYKIRISISLWPRVITVKSTPSIA